MSVILIITSFFLREIIEFYLQQGNFFGKFNAFFKQFKQRNEKQIFIVKD